MFEWQEDYFSKPQDELLLMTTTDWHAKVALSFRMEWLPTAEFLRDPGE